MATKSFSLRGVLGLLTETPLHCGAESTAGYVDLPIQRERHNSFPVIPGSTLKGVLRDELEGTPGVSIKSIFGAAGAAGTGAGASPGSVSFGDGVLVAFPVRSSKAPFFWVSSPYALERVLRLLGHSETIPTPPAGKAYGLEPGRVLLEELLVEVEAKPELFDTKGKSLLTSLMRLLPADGSGFDTLRALFARRLLVLNEEELKVLVETATEVVTRIKLNALGTTQTLKREEAVAAGIKDPTDEDLQGNMFVEELVPPETLFAAPIRAGSLPKVFTQALEAKTVIRLGGDETIGRGVTHMTWAPDPFGKEG